MTATERVNAYLQTIDLRHATNKGAARHLGLHDRRLYTALKDEGTTYTQLLDAEKRRRLEALLSRNPHADVSGICRVAGCASATVTRMMRRYFGVNLIQYRSTTGGQ